MMSRSQQSTLTQLRRGLAAVLFGLFFAAFGVHMWLFDSYFASRPRTPQPDLGLVYALNNHGAHVYLTCAESRGVGLLFLASLAALTLAIAIVPKTFLLPPPSTPKWITKVSARFETGLEKPPAALKLVFTVSILFTLAVIAFAGDDIAKFTCARR